MTKPSQLKEEDSSLVLYSKAGETKKGFIYVIDNVFYLVLNVGSSLITLQNIYPDDNHAFHTIVLDDRELKERARGLIVEDFEKNMQVKNIKTGMVSTFQSATGYRARIMNGVTPETVSVYDIIPYGGPDVERLDYIPRTLIYNSGSREGKVSVGDVYYYGGYGTMMRVISIAPKFRFITVMLSDGRVKALSFDDFMTVASAVLDLYYNFNKVAMYGDSIAAIIERPASDPTRARIRLNDGTEKTVKCSSLRPRFSVWENATV